MSNYINEECFYCKKAFNEDDDIVVCPDCGTPYHRECYDKMGKCCNDEVHNNNGTWKSKAQQCNNENVKCMRCGAENAFDAKFCSNCGTPIMFYKDFVQTPQGQYNQGQAPFGQSQLFEVGLPDKCCGFDPEETVDGVSMSELADYVGGHPYYVISFKRMRDTKKKISFNLLALIFPEFFFANRKMYLMWFLTFILKLVLNVPNLLYKLANEKTAALSEMIKSYCKSPSFNNLMLFASFAILIFNVIIGLLANHIYYQQAVRKIIDIKAQTISPEMTSQKISAKGGTSFWNMLIAFGLSFLMANVLSAVLAVVF